VRTDPDLSGAEFDLLCEYLDYQRETLLMKVDGLTQEQLAMKLSPSELTLAGILYHLSLVEENWMEVKYGGLPEREPWVGIDWDADPNWEFRTATALGPEELKTRYLEACERSRQIAASASDLNQPSANAFPDGRHFSLRWILLHLIEETARHAGHADLIRESIDGSVGE
jgi:uncharacterized damage-inducible protein DinB